MRSRVTVATFGSLLLSTSLAVPAASAAPAPAPMSGPTPASTSAQTTSVSTTSAPTTAARAAACDSVRTTPTFRGRVPSPTEALGFELGSRKVTTAQAGRYLRTVDAKSEEVVTGTFGRSSIGTPLQYALVGRAGRISGAGLARVRDDLTRLQDPNLPAAEAKAIQARTPVVVWLIGNVHGNEPASTDAQLRVLHELADRTDCVSRTVLDNAIIGVIPVQNPDGRNRNTRASAAAFDLNRDWFARTQPETQAKVKLLRSLPGQVVVDEHGMGGTGYYFPPNADPLFHEVAQQPLAAIDDVFGRANAAAFTGLGLAFETWQAGFDLFYPGYGDTFPVLNMGAAGMTYEVGQAAPFPDQVEKHYVSAMTTLLTAARERPRLLAGYHRQWGEAQRQGEQCSLQPNHVDNPGNSVQFEVPGRRVCGYFLRPEAGNRRELARLVSTLQEDGVVVRRLDAPLVVPDYTAYGRPATRTTLPTGTYWIPMAQRQKHWIQAMLGENSYVPFPYFYDVSGWSAPLRAGVAGGSTGKPVNAATSVVPRTTVPRQGGMASPPNIAVLTHSANATNPNQSTGWLTWRLEKDWHLPATTMLPTQITAASLKNVDVMLVPDLDAKAVAAQLGAGGTAALKEWIAGGGHLVAWRGGARLAATSGLTTTTLTDPKEDVPGVLLRANVTRSPLTAGLRPEVWTMYNSDPLLKAADPNNALLTYPKADSPDWFVSGYAKGAEEAAGTTAATSERLGTGAVTLFAFEPNFRGFTDGTARLLWQAISASRGTVPTPTPRASAARLAEQRAASARRAASLPPQAPESAGRP